MPQYFVLLLSTWGVLALVVLILAAYRSQLGRQEDDHIHMADFEATAVPHQAAVAHKIDAVEKWGKLLTVVLVVYGLVLGGYYFYTLWAAQQHGVMMQ
jgi:hypothetical protein